MTLVNRMTRYAVAFVLLLACLARAGDASTTAPTTKPTTKPTGQDWPQFLGPTRDGVYPGGDIAGWPAGGPKELWHVDCGAGWAGPVMIDGKLLLFHRIKDEAVLDCLEADTGKVIWTSRYATEYVDGFGFDAGPRATPAVANGRVFTLGAEGIIRAVELASGKELWRVDAAAKYGADKGFFGLAPSPVVFDDTVILTIGGTNTPVIALDAASGMPRWWSITDGNRPIRSGYASPRAATMLNRSLLLAITRDTLDLIDAQGGKLEARTAFRSRQEASVNAASPLIVGDEIFVSASYGVGARLLRLTSVRTSNGKRAVLKLVEVWANDDSMSNHYATCVVKDGFLYGFHGRQEDKPELRCVEWATGKVRWSQADVGAGTVTLAGDALLVLTEKGDLVMAAASPDGFKELGRKQVLGFDTRAHPAVAGGKLYARGTNRLVCVDLRGK